jgi:hypothetical protein
MRRRCGDVHGNHQINTEAGHPTSDLQMPQHICIDKPKNILLCQQQQLKLKCIATNKYAS